MPQAPAVSAPVLSAIAPTGRSPESYSLEKHYNRVQANFLTRGLLRQDGGGPDTPFTQRELVENFTRIAMFSEYQLGSMRAGRVETVLRRWERPIQMQVRFGDTVTPAQRAKDSASVNNYARRLSRVTGLPISVGGGRPNFHVLIMNEQERRAAGPLLQSIAPQLTDGLTKSLVNLPRDIYCVVATFSDGTGRGAQAQAVAIIRAEIPDLMRLSCIHEELAQGLGLANDSPRARPSIFNDDEEFALLTTHDELLLKMLYDRRLQTGMTKEQVRPIVERIASELVGGGSTLVSRNATGLPPG